MARPMAMFLHLAVVRVWPITRKYLDNSVYMYSLMASLKLAWQCLLAFDVRTTLLVGERSNSHSRCGQKPSYCHAWPVVYIYIYFPPRCMFIYQRVHGRFCGLDMLCLSWRF